MPSQPTARIAPILIFTEEAANLRTKYLPHATADDAPIRAVQRSLRASLHPRDAAHYTQAETRQLDLDTRALLLNLATAFVHEAHTGRRVGVMISTDDGKGPTKVSNKVTLALLARGDLEKLRTGERLNGRPLPKRHPVGYALSHYSAPAFAAACLTRQWNQNDLTILERMLAVFDSARDNFPKVA